MGGAIGLFWLVFWLALYQPPRRNRWLNQVEAAELAKAGVGAEAPAAKKFSNWRGVLTSRPGLTLILARFLTDPVIYFVIFWLPAYLEKERGFSLTMIGRYSWVPFAFGGFGYLVGGWISGRLIKAGWSVTKARKAAMTIGALILPSAILAPLVPTASLAIAAMSLVVFGHAIWVTNLLALPADLFPSGEVATASGFSGMGGAIGGALANWYTGAIVANFSYLPIFICAGVLHPIAVVLVWKLLSERFLRKNSQASKL